MARTRRGQAIQVMEDTSLDRLAAKAISKVAVLASPWVVAALTVGVGALFHRLWGAPATAVWAVIGMNACVAALTALTWAVSHHRGRIGRWHSTATVVLTGGYVTVATVTGVTHPAVVYAALVFGAALAISWNIRVVIRNADAESGVADPLGNLFERAKESAGFAGARMAMRTVDDTKITGRVALESGDKTVEDLQKKLGNIETGMRLPPGTLTITADENRADYADVVVSDPRLHRQVLPYPGPLNPGGSVADPLGLGVYQDMDPLQLVFLEFHMMIMGTTGSGKSFGGAWNLLAAIMSRLDGAILGADITKADQTLGDAAGALHWVAYTKPQALALLEAIGRAVPARTRYLSGRGLKRWERGCGLKAIYVQLEEVCDIIAGAVDPDEVMVPLFRAARSAGIFFIPSLQRADWTQFPTALRSLCGGRMCFGVAEADDAAFCLPAKVLDAGAAPEDWGAEYPGMCYLSAPGVKDSKKPMPVRTYLITPDQMRQLAAAHPAAARPLDDVTAEAFGGAYTNPNLNAAATHTGHDDPPPPPHAAKPSTAPHAAVPAGHLTAPAGRSQAATAPHSAPGPAPAADDDGGGDTGDIAGDMAIVTAAADHMTTADPDPGLHADIDDDAQVAPPPPGRDITWQHGADGQADGERAARKVSPERAKQILIGQLRAWHAEGRTEIAAGDLQAVRDATGGYTRAWCHKMLNTLCANHILRRDQPRRVYVFTGADITDHALTPTTTGQQDDRQDDRGDDR